MAWIMVFMILFSHILIQLTIFFTSRDFLISVLLPACIRNNIYLHVLNICQSLNDSILMAYLFSSLAPVYRLEGNWLIRFQTSKTKLVTFQHYRAGPELCHNECLYPLWDPCFFPFATLHELSNSSWYSLPIQESDQLTRQKMSIDAIYGPGLLDPKLF